MATILSGPRKGYGVDKFVTWMEDELWRGHARGSRTHKHTDTRTGRRGQRQYPKAKSGLG